MKTEIHPTYEAAQVRCSCGNTFETRSTVADLHVELCNECHPFFTGKQKLVDTGGRVERFERRYGARKGTKKAKKPAAASAAATPATEAPATETPATDAPAAETPTAE